MKKSKTLNLSLLLMCVLMSGCLLSCKWFKSAGDKKMTIKASFSMPGILRSLSVDPSDSTLNKVIDRAELMQEEDSVDFMILFERAWKETAPNEKMAPVFSLPGNAGMPFNSTIQEVIFQLNREADDIIARGISITQTRLESLGCKVVSVERTLMRNHFTIELEDVADPQQVLNLIQYDGNLQFWETYENKDIYSFMEAADQKLQALMALNENNASKETKKGGETEPKDNYPDKGNLTAEEYAAGHPLMAILQPALNQDEKGNYFLERGPVVGYCRTTDTAGVNKMLRLPEIAILFPRELHFAWTKQPVEKDKNTLALIALKARGNGKPAIDVSSVITDAYQVYNNNKQIEISIVMNAEGAAVWKNVTADNIGKSIAIVLDDYVYSYPTVQGEIPGGRSSITGNFTESEAKDLASILKAGRLPARIFILDAVTRDKDGNIIR